MASNIVDVVIQAKTEELTKRLAEAGNLSQKQADKIAKEFVKAGQAAEKANAKAADATEKHWTGAAKKIASALGEGTIPKFEKLSGIGEALGGVMGASALKVAVLTGGIAALAAGAAALTGMVRDTVTNLDAETKAMSDVQRAASASAIEALQPYAEAQRDVKDAVSGAKIELAALVGTFDQTDAAFYTGAEFVLHFLRTGEGMDEWSRKTAEAMRRAAEATRKATRYFAEGPASISASDLFVVPDALKPSTSSGSPKSSPRVKAAVDENAELDKLYTELAQNLASYEADKVVAAQQAADARVEADRAAAEEQARYAQELADAQIAEQERVAAVEAQRRETMAQAAQQTASQVGAFVGGLGDLVSTLYTQAADDAEQGTEREKKARRSAFAVAKAAAIAQAAINTALGVTQALTLPFPLNYVNAAIVGALGAVEVGVIAAKQMPTAHVGRMVLAPDEQQITALRGEAVMSRAAVDRMGGEQSVSEANRGVQSSHGDRVGVFSVVYEHRGFDVFASRDLRRPTGALRQAIKGTASAGLIRRV